MRTPLEFIQKFENRYPRLLCFIETKEDRLEFYNSAQGIMVITEMLKEYALEIANDAFDAGFAYAVASHNVMKQNYLNKSEYLQKLKNEI